MKKIKIDLDKVLTFDIASLLKHAQLEIRRGSFFFSLKLILKYSICVRIAWK